MTATEFIQYIINACAMEGKNPENMEIEFRKGKNEFLSSIGLELFNEKIVICLR